MIDCFLTKCNIKNLNHFPQTIFSKNQVLENVGSVHKTTFAAHKWYIQVLEGRQIVARNVNSSKTLIMIKIYLKPRREESLKRKHPWIFSGGIRTIEGEATDGDRVEVFSTKGEYLATGHYHDGSIAVRILSFEKTNLDQAFWNEKIEGAKTYRSLLGLPNQHTNCYRLIHGEGDGLPGLVVDIYNETAVMQCHSIGMHRERSLIASSIQAFLPEIKAVYDKSKDALPDRYARTIDNEYLFGKSEPGQVMENGHAFFVDWEGGQKTGFFIDQRDNRQLLTNYVKGKKVLNAFCYSGGFSVYAAKAGASEVHSIDASQKAMDWTEKNIQLNPSDAPHQSITGNVLEYLKKTDPL